MLSRLETTRWATRVRKGQAVWVEVERARQITNNERGNMTLTLP